MPGRVSHRRVGLPTASSLLRSPAPDRQSRGTVVQAFDDTRPHPLRAARYRSVGPASRPTTSRPRSRCSAPCCSPTTPRRSPSRLRRRRLLQAGPRAHLRGHPGPHGAGRGDRRGDRHRRAQALRAARAVGDPSIFISLQANTPSIANARHYAADRRGARAAAPAHRGGRRDRRHRLLASPRTSRRPSTRPSSGLQRRASAGRPTRCGRCTSCSAGARPDRGARPAAVPHHRGGDRLPRARPDPARPAALVAHHRRRPSRHGEDELRARDPGPRRASVSAGRPCCSPSRWATSS